MLSKLESIKSKISEHDYKNFKIRIESLLSNFKYWNNRASQHSIESERKESILQYNRCELLMKNVEKDINKIK